MSICCVLVLSVSWTKTNALVVRWNVKNGTFVRKWGVEGGRQDWEESGTWKGLTIRVVRGSLIEKMGFEERWSWWEILPKHLQNGHIGWGSRWSKGPAWVGMCMVGWGWCSCGPMSKGWESSGGWGQRGNGGQLPELGVTWAEIQVWWETRCWLYLGSGTMGWLMEWMKEESRLTPRFWPEQLEGWGCPFMEMGRAGHRGWVTYSRLPTGCDRVAIAPRSAWLQGSFHTATCL